MPSRRTRQRAPRRSGWRRHRFGIAGFILLAVAVLLGALAQAGDGDGTPKAGSTATTTLPAASPAPTASIPLPAIEPEPALLQQAQVVDVIDGDTIDVRVGGAEERVRYYGIDTPERGDPCYSEATARNAELVAQTVLLLPDARDRDRFGRLLRYVFDANGASIDARLIGEGLARAWREDGTYRDQFIALETQAKASGAGCLWATAAP
jgi:micrococcal nuclease